MSVDTKKSLELIYDEIFKYETSDLKVTTNSLMSWVNHNTNIVKSSIMELFDAEYVIFPTNHYYHYLNNTINYFEKTKIVCINYYLRYEILNKIKKINEIIRSEDKKYDEIKKRLIILLNRDKLKCLHFMDNMIEPNTLYRKIKFSIEELFLSFEKFSVKRIEYKLKTMCQIAEKMGALNIEIAYLKEKDNAISIDTALTGAQTDIGLKNKQSSHNKMKFDMNNSYNKANQISNLNLNIDEIYKIIDKETDFYIAKEDFLADIDLKFLINSRCINLVDKYNTTLLFEYANAFERQIISKARGFGLNLNISFNETDTESLNITIDFLPLFDYIGAINGANISPYKTGFNQLTKIIERGDTIKSDSIVNANNEINKLDQEYLENQNKIKTLYNEIDELELFKTNLSEIENKKKQIEKNKKDNEIERLKIKSDENQKKIGLLREIYSIFKYSEQTINMREMNNKTKNIPKEKIYFMINVFLESHLKMFNKNKKKLYDEIKFNTNLNLEKVYEAVLLFNFQNNELEQLFLRFFENNLSYNSFEQFRNLLIKPTNNFYDYFAIENYFNLNYINDNKIKCFFEYCSEPLVQTGKQSFLSKMQNDNNFSIINNNYFYYVDKFVYITHQYHAILEFKNQIFDMIKESLDKIKNKLIKKCKDHQHFFMSSNDTFFEIFKLLYSVLEIKNTNISNVDNLSKNYLIELKHYKNSWLYSNKIVYDPKTYFYIYLMNEFKNEYKIKDKQLNESNSFISNLINSISCMKNNNIVANNTFINNNVYLFIKKIIKKSYLDMINYFCFNKDSNGFELFLTKLASKINLNKNNDDNYSLNYNLEIYNDITILTFLHYFYEKNNFTLDHEFTSEIKYGKQILLTLNNIFNSIIKSDNFQKITESVKETLINKSSDFEKTSDTMTEQVLICDAFNIYNQQIKEKIDKPHHKTHKFKSINNKCCINQVCKEDVELAKKINNILLEEINKTLSENIKLIKQKQNEFIISSQIDQINILDSSLPLNCMFFNFDDDKEDFLLTCLCFLIENTKFNSDDLNDKSDIISSRYKKLIAEINSSFEILEEEILDLFNGLFYSDCGFFYMTEDNINKKMLIEKLIKYHKKTKVNCVDTKIILLINLIFESKNINIELFKKLFSDKPFVEKIITYIDQITYNYNNYSENKFTQAGFFINKDIAQKEDNILINKTNIIATYKKQKIFISFEDYIKQLKKGQKINDKVDEVREKFMNIIKKKNIQINELAEQAHTNELAEQVDTNPFVEINSNIDSDSNVDSDSDIEIHSDKKKT